jgi:hypothetical protein
MGGGLRMKVQARKRGAARSSWTLTMDNGGNPGPSELSGPFYRSIRARNACGLFNLQEVFGWLRHEKAKDSGFG